MTFQKETKSELISRAIGIIIAEYVFVPFLVMHLWNDVCSHMFPKLVESGWIIGNFTFWQSFCLIFLIGFLTSINSSSKKKS